MGSGRWQGPGLGGEGMRKRVAQEPVATPRQAQCVAFANHKGGTGKTTSCLSVAGYLARAGDKVLVVDADPQANATAGLGVDKSTVRYSLFDALLAQCDGQQGVPITRAIVGTDVENLHVVPAEFDLAVAECAMLRSRDKTGILATALAPVRALYDFILIDLPPTSGLLTLNGLCAADHVLIPVDPSIFALETLADLEKSFRDIARLTGHTVNRIGAVLTRYVRPDGRKSTPSQEIEAALRKMFDTVFVVPAAEEIYQTQKAGIPISHYAPRSGVGRAYEKIAKAVRAQAVPAGGKKG